MYLVLKFKFSFQISSLYVSRLYACITSERSRGRSPSKQHTTILLCKCPGPSQIDHKATISLHKRLNLQVRRRFGPVQLHLPNAQCCNKLSEKPNIRQKKITYYYKYIINISSKTHRHIEYIITWWAGVAHSSALYTGSPLCLQSLQGWCWSWPVTYYYDTGLFVSL